MKRMVSLFILALVVILLPPGSVRAAGEFSAAYDVEYVISQTGTTIVTQQVALTNKLTNFYPRQYTVLLDSEKVRNVIAYDGKGVIRPTITQKDGKTEILLTFNDVVVGQGKKLNFSLRYENAEIAQKTGSIWEVYVPGVVDDPDLTSYRVSLTVPGSFGPVAYLSPPAADGRYWTKEQMTRGGIAAAYGDIQAFGLELSYYLSNRSASAASTEIALPPETPFQKVVIDSMDPPPLKIRRDEDGNWLAQYLLKGNQQINVTAKLTTLIDIDVRKEFGVQEINKDLYLTSTKYWESDDPKIREVARSLNTPRDIYTYVVSHLSYDYGRIRESPERKGALKALDSPQNSICMEFTDLFIALARAAGIPAREAVGFAYTTNARLRPLSLVSDVLHAWPEYYDEERKLWIPVDPTWASTTGGVNYFDKLDFNHIVFAYHGISSDMPYPAGFYRESGKLGKDVLVKFVEPPKTNQQASFDVTFLTPRTILGGFPLKGSVRIVNKTGVSAENVSVLVAVPELDYAFEQTAKQIPPFAWLDVPITLTAGNYFTNTQAQMTVEVDNQLYRSYVSVRPLYLVVVPVSIILGGVIAVYWFLHARRNTPV